METKLEAVRIANDAGRPAVIANGRTPGILDILRRQARRHALFPRETLVSEAIRALAASRQTGRSLHRLHLRSSSAITLSKLWRAALERSAPPNPRGQRRRM